MNTLARVHLALNIKRTLDFLHLPENIDSIEDTRIELSFAVMELLTEEDYLTIIQALREAKKAK